MARNPDLRVDYEMVQEDLPIKVTKSNRQLMANIEEVRRRADGKPWRIGRFESGSSGYNRARTLRNRADMALFEFTGVMLENDPEGFQSALYCRWVGAAGQSGAKAPAPLTAIAGGSGAGDNDERPPRRQRRG